MIPSFLEKVQNSDKNIEIKYPDGEKLFVGCFGGNLLEFSMIEKKTVHKSKILGRIISMAKTFDNKSQFMCDFYGGFVELDILTHKQANRFNVKSARCCVVTHDNKFLITASNEDNCLLTKWSIRAKKQLNTWKSGVSWSVLSQSCSQDNKYQLIGYQVGQLGIFDLQKNLTHRNIQVMLSDIHSMAFSRNNQSVFISDYSGNIKTIKWKAGVNSGDEFDFTEELKKVGNNFTSSICLTKDEKYLLVGSHELVSVFETTKNKITKEFKLTNFVQGMSLIKDGQIVVIAEQNGNLSILDLETLEISSIARMIANGNRTNRMIVI